MTDFKVTTEFTTDQIAGLICCGMEGGIGYWARITGYVDPSGGKPTLADLAKVFSAEDGWADAQYRHIQYPVMEGAAVLLKATDEDDPAELRFDIAAVKSGLAIMADKYQKHYADFVNETTDADTGDVFIQCCLLGKVVYG